MPAARAERAPAKINLTLRVIGRRPDGYHDLESLVVFARLADTLTFTPGRAISLSVQGPTAAASGHTDDNLVLKAANALSARIDDLKLGRFALSKRLPVAAGLGGGSADAAATLRLIAHANRIAPADPRLLEAARATGADVPVCLDPRPRVMSGVGDVLSEPIGLPKLPAVLVNPRIAVPTKDVFASLRLDAGERAPHASGAARWSFDLRSQTGFARLIEELAADRNDLEDPAISIQPVITDVLVALRRLSGCRLARMSGSGATCFGLFGTSRAASAAARDLRANHPAWWVRATVLG